MHSKFGELLLSRGLISKEHLIAAEMERSVTKERIGKILVRNGFMRQQDLLRILRETNPNALHQEAVFQSVIPANVLLETRSMITAQVEDTLYISTMMRPAYVRRRLAPYLGVFKLEFTATNPVLLDEYLTQIRDSGQDDSVSWESIFYDAMRDRASDIHIMPRHASYTVLVRRDGVMSIVHEGTRDEYTALCSRIKDLSKMDMAERRRPQDGGFSMDYSGRVVNFRVVTVPMTYGEKLIVRILDPDAVNLSLGQLGISRVDIWRRAVGKADGLCLICGPTGSGKTTTLSATAREMNFLERAIYTIEDPVEYDLPYACQVSSNQLVGLDFSAGVRTFMRSDPDVIIVGEIRDIETARNALKAAETGHLVLGTLHTGSIINAVSRLRDIGVEPHELRHLLRGVMVQRLMRVYCKDCGGAGCPRCRGTGYRGRELASEVAAFTNEREVDSLLAGIESWPTILEDAKQKVHSGRTSAAELERVFGEEMEEV